jgi:hypothetical protein
MDLGTGRRAQSLQVLWGRSSSDKTGDYKWGHCLSSTVEERDGTHDGVTDHLVSAVREWRPKK